MTSPAYSPAADRNKHAIFEALRTFLPAHGNALEIASGTGQHAAWFAAHLAQWTWQPTDATADAFSSIAAWAAEEGATNVGMPLVLDVLAPTWLPAEAQFDLVYCANMLHISPWATCVALMHGSARHLAPGGVLVTYGPYLEDGVPTSEGNLSFDAGLRAQDPAWGIRRIEDVEKQASAAGLKLLARHAMPANNLLLVWGLAQVVRGGIAAD